MNQNAVEKNGKWNELGENNKGHGIFFIVKKKQAKTWKKSREMNWA